MTHQSDTNLLIPYQLILEASGFAFFVVDQQGIIQRVSASAEQVTGYNVKELVGQNLRDFMDENGNEQLTHFLDGEFQQGAVHRLKLPFLNKAQDYFWVEAHLTAQQGADDMQYFAIIRDISVEVKLAAELKTQHHYFRGLFEKSNDAVFFINLDGFIINVNQAAANMLGTTIEEQIGRDSVLNTVEQGAKEAAKIRQALIDGKDVPIYERSFYRKDGSTFPAEINIALVRDEEGHPSHYQSIVRDISVRRKTALQLEEQLRQLNTLREIDVELMERLNPDYVLTMALDSAMRLSGAESGFIGLLNPKGALEAAQVMGDYPPIENKLNLETGIVGRVMREMHPEVIKDVSQDPDYIAVRVNTYCKIAVPLVAQDNVFGVLNLESSHPDQFTEERFELIKQIASRIAIAFDNARLYRQSETQLTELKSLYDQIKLLEELKTDMIRMASHDLRNPLGGIIGFVDLIKSNPQRAYESGALLEYLDSIQEAAVQMKRITEDILTLERLENAREEVFNVTTIVKKIFDQHVGRADLHKHTLTLDIDETDLPIYLMGDPSQIREAIDNLVGNAIKYTPSGGQIDLSLLREGPNAVFKVKDNGIGVKEKDQERLFKPFSRIKSRETALIEGTGLGLHLVKQIIERHGGRMLFESVHGEGSMFGFSLLWIMN